MNGPHLKSETEESSRWIPGYDFDLWTSSEESSDEEEGTYHENSQKEENAGHGRTIPRDADTSHLSDKALKRLDRFEKIKRWKKERRKDRQEMRRQEKAVKKDLVEIQFASDKPTKRELKCQILAKLEAVQKSDSVPKICIDMGLANLMNSKEIDRLAGQIRRVYGSNRQAARPLHLTFANLETAGAIYKACQNKNDGFAHYRVNMTNSSHLEIFPPEKIIYLTPDSDSVLMSLEDDRVYVLGGLVDESPNKNHTLRLAEHQGLATARLPIDEYLQQANMGSFNKILSINQIFDILLTFYETKDWAVALLAGIPKRKGFIAR